MATKTNDFYKNNSIKIPIIQRDYVQGSNLWAVKRDEFICSLFDALRNNNPLLLDFIYGVKDNEEFIPLDGQQRLTTLSLLGWLMANFDRLGATKKDEEDIIYADYVCSLGINYSVRESSREFCRNLFKSKLKVMDTPPSEEIKNFLWFAESWQSDPSIKSMLQMLDRMAEILLSDAYRSSIGEMSRNFFDNSPIEFEETILPTQKNPDDLYIKINARGKHLTEFEHWKVKFIQILDKYSTTTYSNTNKSLREYFEEKIETDWCDLFWDYAIKHWDTKKDRYPSIDSFIMNFIKNITYVFYSVCWGGDLRTASNPDAVYRTVYRHSLFSKILFDWFDALAWIVKSWKPVSSSENDGLFDSKKIEAFFAEILFSVTDINDIAWLNNNNKVNIFNENGEKTNLFESVALSDKMEVRPLLLLVGILSYIAINKKISGLEEFTRQWWTLIMTLHRQRLKDGFAVRADISLKDHGKEFYACLLRLLKFKSINNSHLNSPAVYRATQIWLKHSCSPAVKSSYKILPDPQKFRHCFYQSQIVPFYNCPWLLADIRILHGVLLNTAISTPATDFYNKIVMPSNIDRIKTLIDNGYEGTLVNSSNYTFGIVKKIWPYIFTDSDCHQLSNALCNILSGNKQTAYSKDWLAEFVYENIDILNMAHQEFAAFMKVEKYELFSIPEGRSFTKQGFRLEPYAFVVAKKSGAVVNAELRNADYINVHGFKIRIDLYSVNSTRYGISFPEYKLHLESVPSGWRLAFYSNEGDNLPASFIQRFGSGPFKDNYNKYIINEYIFEDNTQKNHVDNGVEIFQTICDFLS